VNVAFCTVASEASEIETMKTNGAARIADTTVRTPYDQAASLRRRPVIALFGPPPVRM
jgi:hypothetical protein